VKLQATKTYKDLIKHAFDWYGLTEQQTKEILKSNGYEKFNNDHWWSYLNILKEHWDHIIKISGVIKEKEQVDKRIQELFLHLTILVEPDCWHYEGPQEVLDLIAKHSRTDRERNVKKYMQRTKIYTNNLTPYSPRLSTRKK
jgi:hypothetical protein